jgi:hypothetical protein
LFAAAIGFVLIDRGSDEAEEQVTKAMSPMVEFVRSPWAGFAAAVIGGLVLQRLLRAKREVVVNPTVIPVEVVPTSAADDPKKAKARQSEESSFSRYVNAQLRSLGTVAAEAAVAMGMQTLGVPSLEELVRDLLGGNKHEKPNTPHEPAQPSEAPIDETMDACGSTRPSHNGFNYAEYGAQT